MILLMRHCILCVRVSSRSGWADAYSSAVIYWLDVLRIHYNWFLLFSFFVFVFSCLDKLSRSYMVVPLVFRSARMIVCVCSICLLFFILKWVCDVQTMPFDFLKLSSTGVSMCVNGQHTIFISPLMGWDFYFWFVRIDLARHSEKRKCKLNVSNFDDLL